MWMVRPSCVSCPDGWALDREGYYRTFHKAVVFHEIGHNLGFRHSGEGNVSYGDSSAVMGNYNAWHTFNAAKFFQGDYLLASQFTTNPTSGCYLLDATFLGRNVSSAMGGYQVLHFSGTATDDFFASFVVNDTDYSIVPSEDASRVHIHSSPGISDTSDQVAKLAVGESYLIDVTSASYNIVVDRVDSYSAAVYIGGSYSSGICSGTIPSCTPPCGLTDPVPGLAFPSEPACNGTVIDGSCQAGGGSGGGSGGAFAVPPWDFPAMSSDDGSPPRLARVCRLRSWQGWLAKVGSEDCCATHVAPPTS